MNIKNELRQSASHLDPDHEGCVAEFSWLPGYLVKLHAEARIAGGKRLKNCILEKNLNLVLIPNQSLYLIPEAHYHLTQLRSLCIAEKIEGEQGKDLAITLRQALQLIELIKMTGVSDLKWRNLVHCEHEKIAIIDTETFWGSRYGLDSLLWSNACDPEAKYLINRAIHELDFPDSKYKQAM